MKPVLLKTSKKEENKYLCSPRVFFILFYVTDTLLLPPPLHFRRISGIVVFTTLIILLGECKVPLSVSFQLTAYACKWFKIILNWSTVCYMQKLVSQNESLGVGGSWIILPFMCETGGLSAPRVYALLSLTWNAL